MIKFISDHHCKSLMVERMVGKEEDLDDEDNVVAEKAVRADDDDKEGAGFEMNQPDTEDAREESSTRTGDDDTTPREVQVKARKKRGKKKRKDPTTDDDAPCKIRVEPI